MVVVVLLVGEKETRFIPNQQQKRGVDNRISPIFPFPSAACIQPEKKRWDYDHDQSQNWEEKI